MGMYRIEVVAYACRHWVKEDCRRSPRTLCLGWVIDLMKVIPLHWVQPSIQVRLPRWI
jgi:hypothetical protein